MCSMLMFGSFVVILSCFDGVVNATPGDATSQPKPTNSSVTVSQRTIYSSVAGLFVEKIFKCYGENRTGKISREKFKELMDALGLERAHDHELHRERREPRNKRSMTPIRITRDYRQKETGNIGVRRKRESTDWNDGDEGSNSGIHKHSGDNGEQNECMTQSEILTLHAINSSEGVSREQFINVCPALIYQIESHACERSQPKQQHIEHLEENAAKWKVWTYGLVSITVISLTSLCVIGVIPLMGRSIYTRVMSFLVALAVGTLAGDALLHLIPHAIVSFESEDHSHTSDSSSSRQSVIVYKSLVVLVGIYVFFVVECIMKVRAARSNNHSNEHSGVTAHACDNVKIIKRHKGRQQMYSHHVVGSRLAGMQRCRSCDCVNLPGSFKSAYLSDLTNVDQSECDHTEREVKSPMLYWNSRENCFHDSVPMKQCFSESELAVSLRDDNFDSPGNPKNNFRFSDVSCGHGNNVHCVHEDTVNDSSSSGYRSPKEGDEHEHEHEHENGHEHGHEHGHNHHINKSSTIATVAWMVIVGDGFHNFGDGMAVGAAFATSLGTGLTTAIAVFCHELPHELGDFAVLVKSGLTIKQAVTYNMVSAVISYIGLILGILIGDISMARGWVLSLTAGMFLYISLVDMLPELNRYISEGGGWVVCVYQNAGLVTGVAIMLAIALNESH